PCGRARRACTPSKRKNPAPFPVPGLWLRDPRPVSEQPLELRGGDLPGAAALELARVGRSAIEARAIGEELDRGGGEAVVVAADLAGLAVDDAREARRARDARHAGQAARLAFLQRGAPAVARLAGIEVDARATIARGHLRIALRTLDHHAAVGERQRLV